MEQMKNWQFDTPRERKAYITKLLQTYKELDNLLAVFLGIEAIQASRHRLRESKLWAVEMFGITPEEQKEATQ